MKGWIAAQGDAQGLRLWRMRGAQVQDRRTAPPGDLDATLTATGWPVLPVIRCGTGAALRPVPAPAALHLTREPGPAPVWIVSGLSQADPTAQMSDTAVIAGLIAASPGFDGVICQPGATTTWARISAQEICHFACFPTGDLLDHLSPRNGGTTGDTGFDAALDAALAQPHRAYGRLATTTSRAELAGLLIGLELAAAKPYWLGERVVVLGDPALMPLYARALTTQGVQAATGNAEAALLAGLYAAFQTVAG